MKKILTYILLIGIFGSLTWFIIEKGSHIVRQTQEIKSDKNITFEDKTKPVLIDSPQNVLDQFINNIKYPISILLLQVIIILFTSRVFGMIFKKLGQQTVIGEIVAGIFLGPSILG